MGVLDEAAAAQRRSGVECRLRTWLQSIDPALADEFRALLYDPQHRGIYHTTVEQVLADHGCDVPGGAVGRHRRRQCVHCTDDFGRWS